MQLYQDTFYTSEINELFSVSSTVAFLLKVESALSQAQAKCKLIPSDKADIISTHCEVRFIDIPKLIQEIKLGGNVAIPLVHQLIRGVKEHDDVASKYVHLGATSQDIIDTATILQIKEYIQWIDLRLDDLINALINLTTQHRSTLMIGRTLLQHARPITFGLKTATWLNSILESKSRIHQCKVRLLKIQLGGAVGAGNDYLNKEVQNEFAKILQLSPDHPWQTSRDSIVEWSSILGILSGTLGKIARDISLLMQTEIAEVSEGAADGKGVSSTMPHKRNPVSCSLIIANSIRTPHLVSTMLSSMMQEHERSAGAWHAEWEVLTQLMTLTAGSLTHSIDLISHLEVNTKKMQANMEMTNGLIYAENIAFALTSSLGKAQANDLVHQACKLSLKENIHLKEILENKFKEIKELNLDTLFNPNHSLGNSYEIIDAILNKAKNENQL